MTCVRGGWLVGAVVLLVVCGVGCGSPVSDEGQLDDGLLDGGLPGTESVVAGSDVGAVIAIPPDSELARMLGPDSPARTFPIAPGVALEAGVGPLWEMPTEPATDSEVTALADVFDIDGEVRSGDTSRGVTHVVGSLDGNRSRLTVSHFTEPTWSLQASEAVVADSTHVDSGSASDDADADRDVDRAVDAVVGEVMAVVGVGPDDFSVDRFTYGPSTEARIEFTPSGSRTDVTWTLTIASDGTVLGGGGPVRTPRIVGEVPTVGLDEAMLRLSRVSPGVPIGTVPVESGVPVASTVPPPAAPVVDADGNTIATVPPPTPPPAPTVLPTILGVEPGLATVWDISNRHWLVPAVVVRGEHGFTTSVPVISADVVRVAQMSEIDIPVRTAPPLTVPQSIPQGPTPMRAPARSVPPPTVAVTRSSNRHRCSPRRRRRCSRRGRRCPARRCRFHRRPS